MLALEGGENACVPAPGMGIAFTYETTSPFTVRMAAPRVELTVRTKAHKDTTFLKNIYSPCRWSRIIGTVERNLNPQGPPEAAQTRSHDSTSQRVFEKSRLSMRCVSAISSRVSDVCTRSSCDQAVRI